MLSAMIRDPRHVLISVGATLGWEENHRYQHDRQGSVLISVGATLGWEGRCGKWYQPYYEVLISVGATLGWEVKSYPKPSIAFS